MSSNFENNECNDVLALLFFDCFAPQNGHVQLQQPKQQVKSLPRVGSHWMANSGSLLCDHCASPVSRESASEAFADASIFVSTAAEMSIVVGQDLERAVEGIVQQLQHILSSQEDRTQRESPRETFLCVSG